MHANGEDVMMVEAAADPWAAELAAPRRAPQLANRFTTCFPDLVLFQRVDTEPDCHFTDEHGVSLVSRLKYLSDTLSGLAPDAASVVNEAVSAIEDEEDLNEETAQKHGAVLEQSNEDTLRALLTLRQKLLTDRFADLGVPRPMPVRTIVLTVKIPTRCAAPPALRGRFLTELQRQGQLQLALMNGQPLDQWFLKLDLFDGPKEEVQWTDWLSRRPVSYVEKLYLELFRRAQEELDRTSLHGNAQPKRLRLMEAVNRIRRANTVGDAISLLSTLDDPWARDLVGRSNAQTSWKADHKSAILRQLAVDGAAGGAWEGLVEVGNWKSVAPLHNPDQVAGGERHLPPHPQNVRDWIGPHAVNSALGRAWGLPEELVYDEVLDARIVAVPSQMKQLRADMHAQYPPACWPLFTTNFQFQFRLV
ncbi:MAG: polymorphic toxin type 15 domain-containing protein [Actinocatenispora sp.]